MKPFGNDVEFTAGVRCSRTAARTNQEALGTALRYDGMLSTSDQTGYTESCSGDAKTPSPRSPSGLPLFLFG